MPFARPLAVLILLPSLGFGAGPATERVQVKVAQKHLVPLCLDGAPIAKGERSWRLDVREHSLAFSMRNEPRTGAPAGEEPGVARVRFTPEPGHRYEIEVRAPTLSFSQRSWKQGEWQPVVRDRTVDRLVSSDPEWTSTECR